MEMETCVPPGFRFHPTEEELVGYYLTKKVHSQSIDLDVIVDVDLYKIEPWDLQQRCKLGYEDQNEWYFFSHKDKKYPTGTRTNRATAAGFWKATGRDKVVMSKEKMIGMRKTLVFYKGRAPNGIKTDWIMHEYRIQTSELAPPQEEGWVVCRAFIKQVPNQIKSSQESTWDNIYTNLSNSTHAIVDHERKVFSSNDLLFPQQNQYYDQSMGSTSDQMLMYESKLQARSNNFHAMAANLSSSDTYETSDFSTVDHVEEHKNGIKELDHGNDDDRSNFGGWQSLDNFVAWQQSEATNSNQLPMMPSDYEVVGGHYLNDYQSIFHAT